jgi:transglutaminase-like putative cysteine protease
MRAEQRGRSVRLQRYPDPVRDKRLSIDLEPIEPRVVFLPSDAVAMTVIAPANVMIGQVPEVELGAEGSVYYRTADERGLRYDVSLAGPDDGVRGELGPSERARYLGLPPQLPARVRELGQSWTAGAKDTLAQARRVEARLRTDYRYDLESPSGGADNPLDHFLFVSRRGHCEFYSTAMAVILRSQGVPTRNVTGFIGGTYNRFSGTYAVRQGDAHSWVEAWIDGIGWTRFDPTPPSSSAPRSEINGAFAMLRDMVEAMSQRWDHHVVGYDLKQQLGLARSVREHYRAWFPEDGVVRRTFGRPRASVLVLIVVVAAIGALVILRRRRRPPAPSAQPSERELVARRITELYRTLEHAMALRGAARPTGTPPLTHASSLVVLGHPIASEVLALTEQYQSVRFGGAPFSDADRQAFVERVRQLQRPSETAEAA